ncbi:MAG: uroporphyrinogen decarboxylase family protein [Candidatus Bathyarchaeota archaeon]|jgi:uroporphyrinogen decarboxylase
MSDRYERVMAAMRREVPDRVPWALWGHFPAVPFLKYYSWEKANRDGEESARAHLALLRALDYKMDLLKVTPFYRFMACQWGSKFRWEDNDESPPTVEVTVKSTGDWGKLWVLDPRKELREALRCVEILTRDLYGMPFIYTIPSPIVQALHGVSNPERVYTDMEEQPGALKEGLETITQTTIDFAKEVVAEGATGIFFGIGGGGDIWSAMNREQLEEYALYYDKKVLDAVRDAPIKLLHICSAGGENPQKDGGLMEDGWFKNYPVDAINWDESEFTPVESAKEIYGDRFCIVGGVDRKKVMLNGTPQQVEAAVKDAIGGAGKGGGFIIGPGCTLNQGTPIANYNAVARAVERYGRYKR